VIERGDERVLTGPQKIVLSAAAISAVIGLILFPLGTFVVLNVALVLVYTAGNLFKLVLIQRSWKDQGAVRGSAPTPERTPDHDLPMYTILLPLYHETSVLDQLIAGVARLDYPINCLDVKLLLEQDDAETLTALDAIDLPAHFEVLVVPDDGPKGKPRACNHGLANALGEYLVIYDAEDRPEADQLRRAVHAFASETPGVVCYQAKLNYFNRTHNVLTRWFTAEYSVWFDQLLPALQSFDVAIPLGGTSNHFPTARLRELGGWNSANVTEDADLGLRLFFAGWRTAILDSTTYEEATSRPYNWIRQRSRWVKGYFQTYFFHMRHPIRLARRLGIKAFVAFQLFFAGASFCLVLNPFYWMLTLLWFATEMGWIQSAFPGPILYLGLVGLFLGNAACLLSVVSGCFKRRNYEDVKWAVLAPVYWILMSVAAWKAVSQLCYKPTYWEKTEHGFAHYDDTLPQVVRGEASPQ
jgi:cellulose synthase/poly-beta-1,6-N-acetylglucosamine synthase-like glycosyltransferase